MAAILVDASVAIAYVAADEDSALAESAWTTVARDGALVPGHWSLEVANALLTGQRTRRLNAMEIRASIADINRLVIRVDSETFAQAWTNTLAIAESYKLTSYDAAYIELALRSGLPLATLDKKLRDAAVKCGASLFA